MYEILITTRNSGSKLMVQSTSERCGFYTHAQTVQFGTISWCVGTLFCINSFRYGHHFTLIISYRCPSEFFEMMHMYGSFSCLHVIPVPDVEDSRVHILNIFISSFQLDCYRGTSNHVMFVYAHLFVYCMQKLS
jgi:hypothetical protein